MSLIGPAMTALNVLFGLQAAKDLIRAVTGRPIDAAISEETAQRIARQRATDEAKDGIAAFLDKRPPAWL